MTMLKLTKNMPLIGMSRLIWFAIYVPCVNWYEIKSRSKKNLKSDYRPYSGHQDNCKNIKRETNLIHSQNIKIKR